MHQFDIFEFCDRVSAIQSVRSFKVHQSHQDEIDAFRKLTIRWVIGHIKVSGNELADKPA